MPTNETILQLNQAGIEVTRGTNVAATRKIYARIAPSYDRPITEFVDTTGTFQGRRRMGYGRQKVAFSATDMVTYEDLAWWLKFMQKGGVVGVTDVGTPPAYTYTFLPTLATDDLNSMTLEFGEPGNPYESGQVMVNDWTLRFDADNDSEPGWMLEAGMIGRDWATTTFTPSLVDRTTEVVVARGTKVFVDTTTIGTTQKTGWLISGSISGNNNLHYKAFSEDENSYAANKVGRGIQITDAELTVEFDSDVDFAQFRATTPVQRKIRLQREGSIIHTT
ncbi:MAG: hypothetical protein M3Q82_04040, partial [Actinomycetota bacterium]|nr:hypothetical protein [Actinomycetota bacterium]